MAFNTNLQIAAGNNNAAGLTAVEELVPSGDIAFLPVQSYGSYDPGLFKRRLDGTRYISGFGNVKFVSSIMTIAQFRYLQETYCSDGYDGLVTVRLRLDDPDTYANYNAVLNLPKHANITYRRSPPAFSDVVWTFTRLEAI